MMVDSSSQMQIPPPQMSSQMMIDMGLPPVDPYQTFWDSHLEEIKSNEYDVKKHELPLSRIKKIMKADQDPDRRETMTAEVPPLLCKACELFILHLTHRAAGFAADTKRRTLLKSDIITAISRCEMFDFLIDIVPREDPIKHHKPGEIEYYGGMVPPMNSLPEQMPQMPHS